MIEGAEERYLHEMLAALHEGYAKAAKPYIERLVAIHMMRPPTPVIMTVEQAQTQMLVSRITDVVQDSFNRDEFDTGILSYVAGRKQSAGTMEQLDRETLLHLLRNPWGWPNDTMREARTKAADELERLWQAEEEHETPINEEDT